jgi:methylase of polypeptide subunit release factors
MKHFIDIILFNPPYVPTLAEEVLDAQEVRDIEGSWAGGQDGMQITNQFLKEVDVGLSCIVGWTFFESTTGSTLSARPNIPCCLAGK